MPTNKKASTRYKILDDLLSNQYHNYSLNDLTFEVNKQLAELYPDAPSVTRRTIEKDINYLEYEGPYLVDIERYSVPYYDGEKQKDVVKRCLKYREPGFSIFKKEMTDDEKYLLHEIISLVGQFEGMPNFDNLESLRRSLKVEVDTPIVSITKNPLENSTIFGQIFTAISHKQVVEITYYKFSDKEHSNKIILIPYLLKEHNRRWFLFGSCESDGKLLCFGLERIVSIVTLPSHVYKEYDGDLQEYFDDVIGVSNYQDRPVLRILFWVADTSVDYIATKPIHESQIQYKGVKDKEYREQYPKCKGGSFFSIDCKQNYELIRELMAYGADLVVLSPAEIQIEIRKKLTDMVKNYKKMT